MLIGATLLVLIFSESAFQGLGRTLGRFLAFADQLAVDPQGILLVAKDAAIGILSALFMPFLVLMGVAAGANLIQHKPVFTFERVTPKLSKISLFKGVKRLFSARALTEFAKGIAKLVIVGAVAVWLIWPERDRLEQMMTLDFHELMALIRVLMLKMLGGVVVIMAFVAGADTLFQRFQHHKRLRMTKQDVKDELKQSEGDPLIRARIRQIRSDRARQRMIAAVPEADVVITNPTHYAVALKYDIDTMQAPVLVAKGIDTVAQRIRQVAEENKVPVVENPPLARALHASVELDGEVPPEHYHAVAKVIGYILELKGKMTRPRRTR